MSEQEHLERSDETIYTGKIIEEYIAQIQKIWMS